MSGKCDQANVNGCILDFLHELHWNHFPSPYSAVPVSFLAKSFLNDTFEPPVKRQTHPKLHAALTGSNEKRELWLDCVIGKYMKNLADAKATGKAVNIKSMGLVFFHSGNDDAMVRHTAFPLPILEG